MSKFNMGAITPEMMKQMEQLREAKEEQRYVNETLADR